MKHWLRLFLVVLLGLGGVGCSGPRFGMEWRKALKTKAPAAAVEGAWEGGWLSDANGHHGPLRCVVTRPVAGSGVREFYYQARWGGVFSGGFRTKDEVSDAGAVRGVWDLGTFGKYGYEGTMVNGVFQAKYKSAMDHGSFTMKKK